MQLLGDSGNLLLIVLGFGLLIAVHEFGHFIAARWAGIRVDAFAIGMGPAVLAFRRGIGWRMGSTRPDVERRFGGPPESIPVTTLHAAGVGETEYGIRLLPIGGFVRMKGQEDLQATGLDSDLDAYGARPVWKRMVVVSAGVCANIVLAVLLYVAAFLVGVRFESPTIGELKPGGPAATAKQVDGASVGLQPGDRITFVNGEGVNTFADVQIAAAMSNPGTSLHVTAHRHGVETPLHFDVMPTDDPMVRLRSIGIAPARDLMLVNDPVVQPLLQPALTRAGLWAAGVRPGWRLESIQGVQANSVESLQVACTQSNGAAVPTTWRGPEGATASVDLHPIPQLQHFTSADEPALTENGLLGLIPLTRIDWVRPSSPNDSVLKAGDLVLAFQDHRGPSLAHFRSLVQAAANQHVRLEVLRQGEVIPLSATVDSNGRLDVLIAAALQSPLMARSIDRVAGENGPQPTPAASLQLQPLTRVVSVDGTPVSDWETLQSSLRNASTRNATIPLVIQPWGPNAPTLSASITLPSHDIAALQLLHGTSPLPLDAFDPLMTTLSANGNPIRAVVMGFQETKKLAVLTWLTLDRLVRGSVSVDQLRGPVGIVHVGTRVADRGFMYLVFFLAMISVNLAVLNFLPLPIVDGGLFLFLAYEGLLGRPPSVRFQNAATMAGLLLLGSLFIVTFYNDVMRLVVGSG